MFSKTGEATCTCSVQRHTPVMPVAVAMYEHEDTPGLTGARPIRLGDQFQPNTPSHAPRRPPNHDVEVFERAVTCDRLSNGRLFIVPRARGVSPNGYSVDLRYDRTRAVILRNESVDIRREATFMLKPRQILR